MVYSDISQHPVFEELELLIDFFPSPNTPPEFTRCLCKNKSNGEQCKNRFSKARNAADGLWGGFRGMKECPYTPSFYEDVNRFLEVIHCKLHNDTVLSRFNDWKQRRGGLSEASLTSISNSERVFDSSQTYNTNASLSSSLTQQDTPETPRKVLSSSWSYDSPETSLPSTPYSDRVFDSSPIDCDITPFSSPLTAYETPEIAEKSKSFDSGSFFSSPTSRSFASPSSFVDEEKFIAGDAEKDVPLVADSATSTNLNAPFNNIKPDVIVKSTTEVIVTSSRDVSSDLPIMTKKEVGVENTHTKVSVTQAGGHANPHLVSTPVGICNLKRTATMRSFAPIITELYNYLTPYQVKNHGILYVLRHKENSDVFKVGFTTGTAAERLNHSGNCCHGIYDPVYESNDKFFAAKKAEILALKVLTPYKLNVVECNNCEQGHRELFTGSEETIVNQVRAIENFIRLEPYVEGDDGVWRFSVEEEHRLNNTRGFSRKALQAYFEEAEQRLNVVPAASGEVLDTKSVTATQTTAVEILADVNINSTEPEESTGQASAPLKISGQGLRARLGEMKRKVGDHKNKLFGRSRASTPEADNTQESSMTAAKIEENIIGFLWDIIPDNDKPEIRLKDEEKPRTFHSLMKGFAQIGTKFKEDFIKAAG
ncbi:hypothetical protein FGRMN_4452 [Fusarium graminum]|nr:hypothetical protein FGRMN_4452 [Fusarium graminum]